MKIKNHRKTIVVAVLIILVLLFVLFNRSGALVVVGANGIVRKEKYIKPENLCYQRTAPTWCPDEYSMAYSSDASSFSDNSFYNAETGMCSDGTRDCIYTEKYNDNRVLQGVFNSKNEELSKKFLDDVYSGKVTLSDYEMAMFRDNAKFENGTMKIRNQGGTTWYTMRVGTTSAEEVDRLMSENNILVVPPSMFIMYVAAYFKSKNLPKPTIKYELKSEMNMNQFRSSLQPSDGSSQA